MFRKIGFIICGLICSLEQGNAQNKSKMEYNIKLGNEVSASKLVTYNDFIINSLISDSSKSKRDTPENLLLSYLSSKSQGWHNSLFKGKVEISKSDLETKKAEIKNGIYIKIDDVLYITYRGNEYSVMKYHIRTDKGDISATLVSQRIKGIWYITTDQFVTYYNSMLYLFKPVHIFEILVQRKSSSAVLSEILNTSVIGDKIDVYKFYDILLKKMENNKEDIQPLFDKLN